MIIVLKPQPSPDLIQRVIAYTSPAEAARALEALALNIHA